MAQMYFFFKNIINKIEMPSTAFGTAVVKIIGVNLQKLSLECQVMLELRDRVVSRGQFTFDGGKAIF